MLNDALELLGRVGRKVEPSRISGEPIDSKLNHLRTHGYVTFDHLVGTKRLTKLQEAYRVHIEEELNFEMPTLGQALVNSKRDADLIASNFFGTPEMLAKRKLTFERGDVTDYAQAVRDFRPSTLTSALPDEAEWFDLWLDAAMLKVIEGYMGFVPRLEEAYIRRNFPSDFVIMNHAWHRDTNHPKHLLKAFFFLSNCTLKTGPHHYITGTIQDRRLDGQRYYTDEDVYTIYPKTSGREIVSEVPAGTIILEDTRGLHKAGIPQEGFRDLGYATFLPPIAIRQRPALYRMSRDTFETLSPEQKRYVPSTVLRQ